jgi:hypothetical protein
VSAASPGFRTPQKAVAPTGRNGRRIALALPQSILPLQGDNILGVPSPRLRYAPPWAVIFVPVGATVALYAAANVSQSVGVYGVDVIALHAKAKAFYLKYNFVEMLDAPLHLFLPIETARIIAGITNG